MIKRTLAAICFFFAGSFAQGEPSNVEEKLPLQFQVLERRKINLGNRALIMNRVAPPILPTPPPAPSPPPSPTAEQIAAMEAQQTEQKRYVTPFISATVYDHQVTAVRWSDENGSYLAYSNIDFTYFCGVTDIETADAVYMLMMGIGNESRAQVLAFNRSISAQESADGLKPMPVPPPLSDFSATRAEYVVMDNPEHPVSEAACASIEALHVYFDANKQRLMEDYAKREAARIAKEKWDKEHPPIPKDTVINFWPEKSTVYPTAPTTTPAPAR